MLTRYLAAALLTTALMTGMASAQTSTTNKADPATTSTMQKEGEWRASKLVGLNVYNDANEKIGEIDDVILDKSGRVDNVIIGVGGFLGMGEHHVAVSFDKLKWMNEPVRTTVSSSTAPGNAPATNVDSNTRTAADGSTKTTGAATTSTRNASDRWYPDHAVLSATKDQLKAMPQFKF